MRTRGSEQDHILRLIQQLAAAARRLRELLTNAPDSSATVRAEVASSIEQLLGNESAVLSVVDAATAVRLLPSRARLELWVELLELDADACERAGLVDAAREKRARAAALRSASAALDAAVDEPT